MKEMKFTIGLEIHAQVNCESKLFSSSSAKNAENPNENVSVFDLGLPGVLPQLNENIIKKSIEAALTLNSNINKYSRFDRKHYYYADSPFGYQITQFFHPIATGGFIDVGHKKIHLHHFHIETDAGKMIHVGKKSLLDFNRVGVPLIEIVTEPEIETIDEFKTFISELILKLQYAEVCDCNMELGNFRIDVNISVSNDPKKLGTRVEIKNLNSVRFAIEAINYEYRRQVELIARGKEVEQTTVGFNSETGETFLMRAKEEAMDYRYFPDYNIPPLEINNELIESIKQKMNETPEERRARYIYLGEEVKEVLVNDYLLGKFFDEACGSISNKEVLANLIVTNLIGLCKKDNIKPYESKVSTESLNEIVTMLEKNIISIKIAKFVLEKVFETGEDPVKIVENEGLVKITDINIITKYVLEVISENPSEVVKYKGGNEKLLMFFLGKIIKKTNGRVDPILTQMILKESL